MTEQEQIEEMAKFMHYKAHGKDEDCDNEKCEMCWCSCKNDAELLYNAGYRKLPEDSVVLSREEYEKLKSLYDIQKGAIMTSSIGDLPLTVEGLRKAVDEITRLNRVETELQELNIKYYNEAKDYRRELKQASKETAEKILKDFKLWAREYQNKDTVVDENGERLMTNNEKLNYLYTYLCDKYKVEIKDQEYEK